MRPLLEAEHRVSTPELWQEGSLVDIVLDAIPGESAALVGASFGGGGALEAAAAAPERVEALVLINSNPFGWSDDVTAIMREEDALAEAGRLDDAAALMVRAWLVGARREEVEVPRELRDLVFAMERRAYELPQPGREANSSSTTCALRSCTSAASSTGPTSSVRQSGSRTRATR